MYPSKAGNWSSKPGVSGQPRPGTREAAAARRLNGDVRDQVNLTAAPLTQDSSVSDISRACTILERWGGVEKATHPPLSTKMLFQEPFSWLVDLCETLTSIRCNCILLRWGHDFVSSGEVAESRPITPSLHFRGPETRLQEPAQHSDT